MLMLPTPKKSQAFSSSFCSPLPPAPPACTMSCSSRHFRGKIKHMPGLPVQQGGGNSRQEWINIKIFIDFHFLKYLFANREDS